MDMRATAPGGDRVSMEQSVAPALRLEDVVRLEEDLLAGQGRRGGGEARIGLALSGGGVRSATVSLGFLEQLFKHGLIEEVDYLSTVSGAGYASGYLYARMAELSKGSASSLASDESRHEALFGDEAVKGLREAGKYLNLGTGLRGAFMGVRLVAATLNTMVLNLAWVATGLAALVSAVTFANQRTLQLSSPLPELVLLGAVPLLRLFALASFRGAPASLQLGRGVNWVEGVMLLVGAAALLGVVGSEVSDWLANWCPAASPPDGGKRAGYAALVSLVTFVVLGFAINPGVLGLFGVFRERIAAAYLKTPTDRSWSLTPLRLQQLAKQVAPRRMPYPLFNCCVYLRADADTRFSGTQTVDYFLLSPLACGSSLTRFVRTDLPGGGYTGVTLADTVTTSAASITPLMDGHANPALAFAFWSLNLNLGTWLNNPRVKRGWWPVFWPVQYLRPLLGKLSTNARLIFVADGGFIDNLGAFELLRRRCALIIVVDNTYDPKYEFKHLRNLVARARAELGLSISFRGDPEHSLRPAAATGFAKRQYEVADIVPLDGANGWRGALVYAKACVLSPRKHGAQGDRGRDYKTYHPNFPQESTADQFYDEAQWQAYFTLGQRIFGEVFGGVENGRLEREAVLKRFSGAVAQGAGNGGV